jgi:hypothetical protein
MTPERPQNDFRAGTKTKTGEIRNWVRNKHPTPDDRISFGKNKLFLGPEMGPENDMHF